MTVKEMERLAVVETQVAEIKADVAEIKTDVKLLMQASNRDHGALTFVRTSLPWLMTAIVIMIALIDLVLI